MARPEKRWQLLLVADDGRIIPFKRIKGIAVTLSILLVLLGLACAGLGWQLTVQKVRHHRVLDQLADAERQVRHYKSEHELITAELVLAEARMKKAGLLDHGRQERMPQHPPLTSVDAQTVPESAVDGGQKKAAPEIPVIPMASNQVSLPPAAPPAVADDRSVPETAPVETTPEQEPPAVALGDLEIKHDPGKRILLARFRVNNTGPRSSPVAGRCVVVLKDGSKESGKWLAMPEVTLVNGKPDGVRGQAFRISRFRDMEIKAMGQKDPSSFKRATVYVFDASGATMVEKDFSIDIPAPAPAIEPVSRPAAQPNGQPETTEAPAGPPESPPVGIPAREPAPFTDSGETPPDQSVDASPEADAGTASPPVPVKAPVDDPSLTEGVEPVKKEDARSRF